MPKVTLCVCVGPEKTKLFHKSWNIVTEREIEWESAAWMKKDIACQIVRRWNLIGWKQKRTIRTCTCTCTWTLLGCLLSSISDCIWRQRGTVIESNVGQRETRRHTHSLSHTWSDDGNDDHTYDGEGDKTKQSQIKASNTHCCMSRSTGRVYFARGVTSPKVIGPSLYY